MTRRRRSIDFRILLAALAALALSGCTYVYHRYLLEQPLVQSDDWEVYGGISRYRPQDEPSIGGYPSTANRAREDDEYRLTLSPVPKNADLWSECTAELVSPRIVAGAGVIDLEWATVEDARVDSLGGPYTESFVEYRETKAPLRFESTVFHLPVPPPDSLLISSTLVIRNVETGEEITRTAVSAWAMKEKHRRWSAKDAIEL
jgi:hypothetical protein